MKVARCFAGTVQVLAGSFMLALCLGACADSSGDPETLNPVVQLDLKKGCGDGVCGPNEHCKNCESDCGPCRPVCGDAVCSAGAEDCTSCPADCGACPPVCGDGSCNGTETCVSCSADCGACPPACGDGSCNGCETCDSCALDCGACGQCTVDTDCAPAQVCHPTSCITKTQSSACVPVCDASCQPGTLDCGQGSCTCQSGQCVAVLKPVCGDGACNGGESCATCAGDCGVCASVCGDGACNGGESCESCPGDCGACGGCAIDADCVPAPVCHPSSCVPYKQAPDAGGFACDTGCQPFTLDCGQGYCACQQGQCVAVITDSGL